MFRNEGIVSLFLSSASSKSSETFRELLCELSLRSNSSSNVRLASYVDRNSGVDSDLKALDSAAVSTPYWIKRYLESCTV